MGDSNSRRSLWQVIGLYIAGSWVCLQVVDLLTEHVPLPSWTFMLTLVLLLIGLPITAATAYLHGLRPGGSGHPSGGSGPGFGRRVLTWRNVLLGGTGAMAVWGIAVSGWLLLGAGKGPGWDLVVGLEEIDRLTGESDYAAAYALAETLDAQISADSNREELWARVSMPLTVATDPPGARVFRRTYAPAGAPWVELGTTPLRVERFPYGTWRLRLERDGHATREIAGPTQRLAGAFPMELVREGEVPEGMVRIDGGSTFGGYGLFAPGLEQVPAVEVGPFFVSRYEVTNRAFRAFVDAGGYEDPACWRHPFVEGRDTLSFGQGTGRFLDATGRPGPATWDAGSYPPGSAEQPVGGLSWYEADAYACWRGMALPTVYHWYAVADPFSSAHVVPLSNFGDEVAPVGAFEGVSGDGVYDLAGNVREWTVNASGESRFILGGGWADLEYAFNDVVTAPAFDRSALNGIRLVQYVDSTNLAAASAELELAFRDYRAERPASDEVFAAYRQMYAYDATPLDARVVSTDTTEAWIRERVEMAAGYGGERLTVFLYLPRDQPGPLQTIVLFPGSGDIYRRSYADLDIERIEFLVRGGRAVVYPIYKGTFERGTGLRSDIQDESNQWRDHVIAWATDLSRSVDYVATRPDLDLERLAYLGISWGGAMAPIMAALEERIRVNVIWVGGLLMQDTQPVVDPFHFLPRVRQPTLMLSARWDSFYPLETAQRPFFDNLGTPPDQRRMVVIDANHGILSYDRNLVVQETLDWLDRHLGPVR